MAIMYRTIKCPKCGKSFRVREEKIKKTCPYCGNEIVLKNMNDIINEIKDAETISVKTGGTNKDTISELMNIPGSVTPQSGVKETAVPE